LLSKGCGSFGHLASPDAQVNSALDYPLWSCDALVAPYQRPLGAQPANQTSTPPTKPHPA
jgi:hypothetical protein